ncbi:SMODS-associated NUDIX domain-containing protein [Latilactobacillus curvatus]|uniref:CD-NTase-associated protein 16 NUDIX domain-containing protein n=2 Tax=Latilactobacillus curvatus TaxID=28038 RepID=A0A385ABR2_LATCU|nr:HU-CCDC81 and SPOR domain-containing protein [Latilactobacillus curvatus]AXN35085.1 hypothetical protein DT351_01335 [Latilactobacillus curvatus]
MKRILKFVGYLLILFVSIGIVCMEMGKISETIGNLIAGALIMPFLSSCRELSDNKNWKVSQRKLEKGNLLQRNTKIRISFAYLFRIKVDGKYFLVKNSHTKRFQPVGGTYKYYEKEAQYLRTNFSIENDDRIPVNENSKDDYRLYVKNKQLRKFVKRFDRTESRERITDLHREFDEELFQTEILDKRTFGSLKYNYCGRHMTDIKFGNIFDTYELLLADIIEVQLSDEQEDIFRGFMSKSSEEYYFATEKEIKTCGVEYGTSNLSDKIANHTVKILSGKSDELIMKNKHKDEVEIVF